MKKLFMTVLAAIIPYTGFAMEPLYNCDNQELKSRYDTIKTFNEILKEVTEELKEEGFFINDEYFRYHQIRYCTSMIDEYLGEGDLVLP